MSNAPETSLESFRSPKSKRVALKKIQSSPQLKNVLRQKWQQRLKEKRSTSFNWQRFQPGEAEKLIDESVSDEMYEVMNDMIADWEDWFQKKYAEEEELSAMSEYEDFLTFEKSMDTLFDCGDSTFTEVICPMCQKNILTEECGEIGCSNCKFVIPAKASLADFSDSINSKSTMHSENCIGCPTFITTPENDTISLFLICDICSCCLLIM